jgi:hypothetical protein
MLFRHFKKLSFDIIKWRRYGGFCCERSVRTVALLLVIGLRRKGSLLKIGAYHLWLAGFGEQFRLTIR